MERVDIRVGDGFLLRHWRNRAGLTQARAAAALGISPRMLAYYEGGKHDLPRAIVLAVRSLASKAGIRLPGAGMDRAAWVAAVGHAVAYGRGEAVVGSLVRQRKHAELRDLLDLLRAGPDPEMALTDPALFRALREAGTRAYLSGVGTLQIGDQDPPVAPVDREGGLAAVLRV